MHPSLILDGSQKSTISHEKVATDRRESWVLRCFRRWILYTCVESCTDRAENVRSVMNTIDPCISSRSSRVVSQHEIASVKIADRASVDLRRRIDGSCVHQPILAECALSQRLTARVVRRESDALRAAIRVDTVRREDRRIALLPAILRDEDRTRRSLRCESAARSLRAQRRSAIRRDTRSVLVALRSRLLTLSASRDDDRSEASEAKRASARKSAKR
ncbi:MAG: hypothetical protein CMA63_06650 [Euryarchaeota archaeon]|nr:hypothetical protein [Euryarchaeota archaeon]